MSGVDKLYEQEKRVAEYYAAISSMMRRLWKISEVDAFLDEVVRQIGRTFQWHTAAIMLRRGNVLELRSCCRPDVECGPGTAVLPDDADRPPDVVIEAVRSHRPSRGSRRLTTFPQLNPPEGRHHYLAYPLLDREALTGVLLLGREGERFDDCETDVLHDLAEHIALALDNIAMYEQREQFRLAEERSRLARDLHDSVNQKLFSLTLFAQGLADDAPREGGPMRTELQEIVRLSHEAMSEMKALIWDLHRNAEAKDLLTRLSEYAGRLGLTAHVQAADRIPLPDNVEEALWRIGQEALNNVHKHAGTDRVSIEMTTDGRRVCLVIRDRGRGFSAGAPAAPGAFGLRSMRERAGEIRGVLRVDSTEGSGTTVRVAVPAALSEGDADDH